jgi:hypothetical protein
MIKQLSAFITIFQIIHIYKSEEDYGKFYIFYDLCTQFYEL